MSVGRCSYIEGYFNNVTVGDEAAKTRSKAPVCFYVDEFTTHDSFIDGLITSKGGNQDNPVAICLSHRVIQEIKAKGKELTIRSLYDYIIDNPSKKAKL